MIKKSKIHISINGRFIDFNLYTLSPTFNHLKVDGRYLIKDSIKLNTEDKVKITLLFESCVYYSKDGDENLTIGCYKIGEKNVYIGINTSFPYAEVSFSNNEINILNVKSALDINIGIALCDNLNENALWYGCDPDYCIE